MGKDRNDKTPEAIIYGALSKIINGTHSSKNPMPDKYYVTEMAPGAFTPLKVINKDDPDIVEHSPRESVIGMVVKYCERVMHWNTDYLLTVREVKAAVDFWLYTTDPVPKPKSFSWPGESGLTFTRLPWKAELGEWGTWHGLLSRMTNYEAFMAWVGSLFHEDSYLQQYVWLKGEGNDGKGAINRFLEGVFGPAYCSKQPKERGDKFWAHELMGKRLVVFPDCNDQTFVASGFFKSLTGGDPIGVEAKGKMAFTTRLNSKYLIFSNEKPAISSESADKRRLIYCELEPRAKGHEDDLDFESLLWVEGGAFLHQCELMYQKLAGTGRPVTTTGNQVEDIAEDHESHFADVFDLYFEIDRNDDEKTKSEWIAPIQLQRICKLAFRHRKTQLEFISYLERKYGVKKVLLKNTLTKHYRYLCSKPRVNLDIDKGKSETLGSEITTKVTTNVTGKITTLSIQY